MAAAPQRSEDPVAAFAEAMAAAGLRIADTIIGDGKLHRVHVADDSPGSKNGWYVLHLDGLPAGRFGSWKTQLDEKWCQSGESTLSDADRALYSAVLDSLQRERDAEELRLHEAAATRAADMWQQAGDAVGHPYLAAKHVQAHGVRRYNNSLLVPMQDTDGKLWSVQGIDGDGTKLFLPCGRVEGLSHLIGIPGDVLVIAEGYATGATIFEVTGHAVAVAFNCGNLLPVAQAWRAKLPEARIVIAADNDQWTAGNPGLTKAKAAAEAVCGTAIMPVFADVSGKPTDFNDLARLEGCDAVAAQLRPAIAMAAAPIVANVAGAEWQKPEMDILGEHRRPAPVLPLEVFGGFWSDWIAKAAAGVSAPPDYVAASLLATVAALIGNARWCSPWPQWSEPTVLWLGVVGRPSSGKSPGIAGALEFIRTLEAELSRDWPETKRQYLSAKEVAKAERERWQSEVKDAVKNGLPPPDMPAKAAEPPEAMRPRIRLSDTTPEALGKLLSANPRGLLFTRDELSGWLDSFGRYSNGGDRAMWIECFNGRDYVIDRVKTGSDPIRIANMTVSVVGGIQPDRLNSALLSDDDDGLAARILFIWPEPVETRRPREVADTAAAETALRRLLALQMARNETGEPVPLLVPFAAAAADLFDGWRREHAAAEADIHGLYLSHWGKLPGVLVRLALVLEYLWWSAGTHPEPAQIGKEAVAAAAGLVDGYLKLMAERTYGDAAMPQADRDAATLAKWLRAERRDICNARIVRQFGPGQLRDRDRLKAAIGQLVESGWLRPVPTKPGTPGRPRADFDINPAIYGS